MKTFFVGTAGLALLAVAGTIAGNSWLTANQRAEAEKAEPWANPSFTTTAVTTGGMLARWMDSDGNLENGHSYVKGIYDLWKSRQNPNRVDMLISESDRKIPQLWRIEINADAELSRLHAERVSRTEAAKQVELQETEKRRAYELSLKALEDFATRNQPPTVQP